MMNNPETTPISAAPADADFPGRPKLPAYPPPPAARKKAPHPYQQYFLEHTGRFGVSALITGIFWVFCFYGNPHGITYPLFIALGYLFFIYCFRQLGIMPDKHSWFIPACAFLLGINSFMTASPTLHRLNTLAQVLLAGIFILSHCYDTRKWPVGKFAAATVTLWAEAIISLPLPFSHSLALFRRMNASRGKNVLVFFSGIALSVPVLVYLVYLLSTADKVFYSLVQTFFFQYLDVQLLFSVFIQILLACMFFYCLICAICRMGINPGIKAVKQRTPLAAISFSLMICLLYFLFCLVQVVYLFARQGVLPQGLTYAQYAREGFFDLLWVAMLNLVFVLMINKYIRKHRLLTILLTVICLCTFVMIASAVYRMVLYVQAYDLTFLRVFVLWFLVLLSVIMTGVVIFIYRPDFPLFRWFLTASTVFYLGFAVSMPDARIAEYNIAAQGGIINEENIFYLADRLSADAAPAIANAVLEQAALDRYNQHKRAGFLNSKAELIGRLNAGSRGWPVRLADCGGRRYNASIARAHRLMQTISSSTP